jgi:hypothetical protein
MLYALWALMAGRLAMSWPPAGRIESIILFFLTIFTINMTVVVNKPIYPIEFNDRVKMYQNKIIVY